ncbi:PrsW family intramembrane metalloprotease [Streptomyces sp. AM 4-1-1]|uniref:PrsW family intramembrane metalloprotease n=1 Tax=Streptomyces sp. AM 4-1-1 TaxID=3028710 RepID=UPI0023B91D04|nr:PrsW family intramembrane metalloprotease [Streptomyces sp. AM 4-1-1]WEH34321.1 PrsW family intramembrane metalloprotease [Streptomyces sp. AM 4-1-1]
MSDGFPQQRQSQPAVPVLEEQRLGAILAAVPERSQWRYRPRRVGMMWRSKVFRAGAVIVALALCGLAILSMVRDQTGTQGFLVGLGLAVLPVPLLMSAFRWLDRVEPGPWRNLLFAFAWGACAAALIAISANSFAMRWLATATADPSSAYTLGTTVIAPIVEESAKAAAVLLIFLFRRKDFTGVVDGAVVAGFTATGFAFTENILYLGNAFGEDRAFGTSGLASITAATFFVRVVMSPFAHPLFTVLTGIGLGLAARGARRRRVRRIAYPLLGLLLAMGMHALWNGSASFGEYGFYAVYGAFMVPVFGLLTWLVIWSRQRELRTLAEELTAYAAAGWLTPAEPFALSSMRARGLARDVARHHYGGAHPPHGGGTYSPYGNAHLPHVSPYAPYGNAHLPYGSAHPAYGNGYAPARAPVPAPQPPGGWPRTQISAQLSAHAKAQARALGKSAARAVAEYESFATSLAFLRRRARHDVAGPDFAARERELLHHLWQRREVAAPALTHAARTMGRFRPPPTPAAPPHQPYAGPHVPYGSYHPGPHPYGPYGPQGPYNPYR